MSFEHRGVRNSSQDSRLRRSLTVAAASLLLLWLTSPAAAETYYVRASGNDEQTGLSPQTAFASIRFAGEFLLEPGDRVIVGPGTYNEGNITPQRNGTPDAPIVFQADASGVMTRDPAGPVIIVPPNMPVPPSMEDNTAGFLLFGKHDIVIEGFTIEGAADAGIQARPHSSTGVDSTRITVRNNLIRNGGRRGIHLIAAGDVTVFRNIVRDNADSAVSLVSGVGTPLRPLASGNLLERNGVGIALDRTFGGAISENRVQSSSRGIAITASERLEIVGNDIVDTSQAIVIRTGRDINLIENVVLGDHTTSEVAVTGTLTFMANQFGTGEAFGADLSVVSDPQSAVRFLQNRLVVVRIAGGPRLEVIENTGRVLRATGVGTTIASDNQFSGLLRISATGDIEVSRNSAFSLKAEGRVALLTANVITFDAELIAGTFSVTGNTARHVRIERRAPAGDKDASDPFLIADNTLGGISVGTFRAPVPGGVVEDNRIAGRVEVYARGSLNVQRNEVGNIAGIFPDAEVESDILLANNTASGSGFSGLIVVGAANALVVTNTSSGNGGSGLAVRRTRNLTVIDNTLRGNGTGGIAVGTDPALAGDCNGDGVVSVDEVVVGLSIALGQLRLRNCDAVDFDGDQRTTIDEVIRAVAGALGVIGPVPPEILNGAFLIRANVIEDNSGFGVKVSAPGSVSAIDNRILRNGGIGIATEITDLPQEVEIVGNLIGSGGNEGILLGGTSQARIQNNLIFSNGQGGILLRDAPAVSIVNNLIYDNGNDGIAIGVGTNLPSPDAVVSNNTLYANAGWGVTIGTAGTPSVGTTITNNIFDRNGLGGIAADLESLVGLSIGFNLNNDGYSHEVTPSVTDFPADPRFVDPAGRDGTLGGDGFEDDDFYLEVASAAVDAGSATAAELRITGSAVAGLNADEGIVDMGFHYGADGQRRTRPRHRRTEIIPIGEIELAAACGCRVERLPEAIARCT